MKRAALIPAKTPASGVTAPGAPTIGTAVASAGQVSVPFTAPGSTGGAAITTYTATGALTGASASAAASPIVVPMPLSGFTEAFSVVATNAEMLTSAPSSLSNTVSQGSTVPVVATAITLSGPTTATEGVATSNYTVALSPNGSTVASPVTVTPTPVAGVTFAPTSLSLTTASPSGTFTANASTSGTKLIAVTNNSGLTNPAAISLVVASAGVDVAPAFSASPTITSAASDVPLVFNAGTATGSPAPTITSELIARGKAYPIDTPLNELMRVPNDANVFNISVRQTATNSAGTAIRMATQIRQGQGTSDPRWTQCPFLRGFPQEGRPVSIGGLTAGGTTGFTYLTKICVSDTELPPGKIDAPTSAAATAAAGTVTNPTSSTGAKGTWATADVGKWAYAIAALTNSQGTIYYRTRAFKVRAAGVATGVLRAAVGGGCKPADGVFTNNGSVPLRMFMYIAVRIGSANYSSLRLVFNNRYSNGSTTEIATGNAISVLSAHLCYPNAAQANCPPVRVAGALPTVADGAYDVLSDAIPASGFGLTELLQGDLLTVKIEIAIPVGAKVPTVSGGDNPVGTQAWVYDPAATTITEKDTGQGSAWTGTAPAASMLGQNIGDGMPFDIVGLQVSGDAPTDLAVGTSIYFNPQGRSPFAVSHALAENLNMPVTAGISVSRIGAVNALFDNSAHYKSKVKYCSHALLEYGANSIPTANQGNSTAQQTSDTTTVGILRANAAAPVAGLSTFKVLRMALPLVFASTNSDTTQFSSTTSERQTPVASFSLGGDVATYYYPWVQSQVGTLFDGFVDDSLGMRLGTDPTKVDYYKAQIGTIGYEAGLTIHPSILGGYLRGSAMCEQLATR